MSPGVSQNQYIDEVVKPRWNAAWTMWLEAVSNARGDASSLTDEIMAQVGPPPPVFEPSEREKIHHRMAARGHAASIKGFVHGYLRGRGATDSFWRSVDDYCAAYYNNY